MKKTTLLSFILLFSLEIFAQGIGRLSINFRDPGRTGGFSISGAASFPSGASGRNIGTEIYYPATSTGANRPIVPGDYPVIVFGHGFAMSWDAYQNIWENLVPRGYIVAFPRTEGGLLPAPSHPNFGADLRIVETLLQQMGITSGNILFGNVSPNGAIMGHSMGGGATFLAAANNTSPTLKTVVGLAPAETNPSAIAAAGNVSVDVLVLSGSSDGVTPPAEHHIPIYNAVNNDCKYFVSLTGGGHCRFANSNFNCEFGETTTGGAGALSRTQVHTFTNEILNRWLDFKLKGVCTAWTDFNNYISNTANLVPTSVCGHDVIPSVSITPVGTSNICLGSSLSITGTSNPNYTYQWFDYSGAIVNATNTTYDASIAGDYFLQATSAFNCSTNSNTVTIIVDQPETPTFSLPSVLCGGIAAPSLPANSNNGIQGTWSPPVISTSQSGTYIFTPVSGQCATTTSITITVANDDIQPTFAPFIPICAGDAAPALPATSLENITGTWSPATISNTESGTYTFTPAPGQCAVSSEIEFTVIIAQTVVLDISLCEGDNFELASGSLVSDEGQYLDTIISSVGCDSLYRTIYLSFIENYTSGTVEMIVGSSGILSFYLVDASPYDSIFWTSDFDIDNVNADTITISVGNPAQGFVNAEIFNGSCTDAVNFDFNYTWSSIRNQVNAVFNIFPNPAKNSITIELPASVGNTDISIINIIGKVVFRESISKQNNTINVSDLPAGFYSIVSNSGSATFIKSE